MRKSVFSLSIICFLFCIIRSSRADVDTCSRIVPLKYRYDKISITDFGGVGDGRTLNTKAFWEAIYRIEHLKRIGGTLLYIPPGEYLTESFNLTSHMTLYLSRGAVIKATQLEKIVNQGHLVSNEITIDLISKRLEVLFLTDSLEL